MYTPTYGEEALRDALEKEVVAVNDTSKEIKEALLKYHDIKSKSTVITDMNSQQMWESIFDLKHITDKFPTWLASQQTLIDQQAKELVDVKEYFRIKQDQVWALGEGQKILESSLNLAVKALEDILESIAHGESDVFAITTNALQEIRR